MRNALLTQRKLVLAVVVLSTLSLLPQREALAWGASGHRMISRLAIESLPAAVPAFLRTPRAAALVGELAREPDRSKGTGDSHDHDRDPGHYINLSDDFAVAGVVPIDPLPATREDYDTDLRSKGTDEYEVGFLPYSIVDGWEQLQKDFAYWRADVAAGRYSTSSEGSRLVRAGPAPAGDDHSARFGLLEPFRCRRQPTDARLDSPRRLGRLSEPAGLLRQERIPCGVRGCVCRALRSAERRRGQAAARPRLRMHDSDRYRGLSARNPFPASAAVRIGKGRRILGESGGGTRFRRRPACGCGIGVA